MLYERWREIAREHGAELALHDLATGERWTFARLASAAGSVQTSGPVAFPQGPKFILTLIAAWRAGQNICPLDPGQSPPQIPGPLPTACIHLKTTSATGGGPRWVAFSGPQLAADADNIVATMALRPDWPNLGAISLAHSYGFSNLVLPLLLHGIPLILAESNLPESLQKAAAASENVTLAAVPSLWRVWHETVAIPKNVKLAISAGAPLSASLEQSVYTSTGVKIHNFYGSSECGGIAYDTSQAPRTDGSCAGAPMKNVELSVADDQRLLVRSRAVGETYWPEPEPHLADGCFRANDLVELRDGLVYFRGRASDLINIAGRKVSPETIEQALHSHPQVRECLVFGAPSADAERNEFIVACVAGDKSLTAVVLKEFLQTRLPSWQIPRVWKVVDDLEANARGKWSRAEWRKRFLDERAISERKDGD